jgi:predicted lipoprotein with Yx(FWY)xxD motif
MKTKLFPVALAGLTMLAMAGCSRSNGDDAAAAVTPAAPIASAAPPTTAAPATSAAPAEFAAKVGDSDLGKILTNADGLTLYGFINDVNATSTCYSTCAEAWPPVIVPAEWKVGPGLDTGIFSTTKREDGSLQLVAGKFPLYTYGGDAAPGDTTGQGSGDVWFAVALDGTLVPADAAAPESTAPAAAEAAPETTAPAPAPAPVSIASTALGDVMVDSAGMTLYAFTKDTDGVSTCNDKCAEAWPPITVDSAELPAGLDANLFSVVDRADGSHQLKAGKWPLYRFSGDSAPGDVNGQGSGGSWFVLDPAGKLIK